MYISELQESIAYQKKLGLDSDLIKEDEDVLCELETIFNESIIRYRKIDGKRSRIMSKASTKNKIRRAMQRPSNRRRIQAGYKRWLKTKGSRYLSKTAKKRFEVSNESIDLYKPKLLSLQKSFEFEDVILVLSKNLIDVESIFKKFEDVVIEDSLSNLEKAKFLYDNFKERFISYFIDQLLENGIVMDQEVVEEATLTSDVAVGDGIRYNNKSPWKNKLDSYLIDYLPFTIKEIKFLLEDIIESGLEDEDTIVTIRKVISELDDPKGDEEVKNFIAFMIEVLEDIEEVNNEDDNDVMENLALMVSDITSRRKYEDIVIKLVNNNIKITESQYLDICKKIKGEDSYVR
jgi:hypothetical protein